MGTQFPAEIFGESLPSDDIGDIYHQAWYTLVQLRTLLELDSKVGYLPDDLTGRLRRTVGSLEAIFPRPAEEPDLAF